MVVIAAIAALLMQGPRDAWTWTFYQTGPSLTLANEIPDTPQVRATLECAAGSGAATVRLYQFGQAGEFSQLRAGQASAQGQSDADPDGSLGVALRVDHPVFAAFAGTGRLAVTSGGRGATVVVGRQDLPKLRRFGELCAG